MKLFNNKWFLVFGILMFLKPSGIDLMAGPIVGFIFNTGKISIFLLILLDYLVRKKTLTIFICLEFLYFLILIFVMWINNSSIVTSLKLAINVIGISLLIEGCIRNQYAKNLVDALIWAYVGLLTYNFWYIVNATGFNIGINNNIYDTFSFLNSDNGTASYFFPAIYIAIIHAASRKRKATILGIWVLVISLLTALKMWSVTTIIGIVLCIIYYLFFEKFNSKFKGFSNKCIIVALVINVLISFFRIQYLFSWFIQNIFNKSVTFTGRVKFWDIGLNNFQSSPLIGTGLEEYYIDNLFIQILSRGGLLLLFAFLALICYTLKKNGEGRVRNFGNMIIAIIIIMSIAESWNCFVGLYIIMCLVKNSESLDLLVEEEEKRRKVKIKV